MSSSQQLEESQHNNTQQHAHQGGQRGAQRRPRGPSTPPTAAYQMQQNPAMYGQTPGRTSSTPPQGSPALTAAGRGSPSLGAMPAGAMQQPPRGFPGYYGMQPYYPGPGGFTPGMMAVPVDAQDRSKVSQTGSPNMSPSFGPMYAQQIYYYPPYLAPQQPPAAAGVAGATAATPVTIQPQGRRPLSIVDPKSGKSIEVPQQPPKKSTPPVTTPAPVAAATPATAPETPPKPAPVASGASMLEQVMKNLKLKEKEEEMGKSAAESAADSKNETNSTSPEASEALERQRKEAEAKAQLEEQQRLAEEKKKKLQEEQEQAERQRKEAEAKRKADELAAKKKQLEEEEARLAEQEVQSRRAEEEGGASQGSSGVIGSVGPSGKITYNLADLFQFKSTCVDMPVELNDVSFDIISVRGAALNRQGSSFGPGSGRGFGGGGGSFRGQPGRPGGAGPGGPGGQWDRSGRGGGSIRGGRGAPSPANLPGGVVVDPIKISENAWKPKAASNELEGTVKKVKGILNKLTLEKFERLSKQMLEIPMTSVEMLRETMAAIFEKALSEPKFGELYADLCKVIVEHKTKDETWDFVEVVQKDGQFYWTASDNESEEDSKRLMGPYASEADARDKAKKLTDFKRILLNKCQEEFEKEAQIQSAEEDVAKCKDAIKEETEEEKLSELKLKLQELTYEALKIKRKVLGNIQFIGELYKKKILTEKVMHSCIVKILFPKGGEEDVVPEEEDLECLCKLLSTIGSTLETGASDRTKEYIDNYFVQLRKISQNKAIAARHRFMILDLIELRENGWQARREELKAKKIEDVHKDIQREEQEKSRAAARGGGPARPVGGRGGLGGRSGRGLDGRDKSPTNRAKPFTQVGALGGGAMAQGYKIGSGPGGSRPPASGSAGSGPAGVAPGAPASSLGGRSSGVRLGPGSSRSGGLGLTKPVFGGQPARGKPGLSSAPSGGRPTSTGKPASSSKSESSEPKLDREKMENKIKYTYSEYVELQMGGELVESMKEVVRDVENEVDAKFAMIHIACTLIVEKKDAERRYVPEAVVTLAKEDILDEESIIGALDEKLEFLGDELMDNPLSFQYYGILFGKLIQENILKLANLSACLTKFSGETPHLLPKFVAAVFNDLKGTSEGTEAVKSQSSTFDLKELLGENATDESTHKFIQDNGMEDLFP